MLFYLVDCSELWENRDLYLKKKNPDLSIELCRIVQIYFKVFVYSSSSAFFFKKKYIFSVQTV